ncbi:MAG: large repetitive protein, partial [Gaiellaceae bacterium]|nr:large repetitive protein [Gaiellaceae bacterium]
PDGTFDRHGQFTPAAGGGSVPPPNDDFANAEAISGPTGQVSGTTNGSTTEALEPNPQTGGVWYSWTAPSTGTFRFECPSSSFQMALEAFSGSALGSLTSLGSGCPTDVAVTAGQVVPIRVAGLEATSGDFLLSWREVAVPGNDDFANASPISGANGSVDGTTVDSSTEDGEPNPLPGGGVWYKWIAPAAGQYRFGCENQSFRMTVDAFTGTSLQTLTPAGSGCPAVVHASAGKAIFLRVSGFPGGGEFLAAAINPADQNATGTFTLVWHAISPPVNDDFGDAIPLTGSTGTVSGTTLDSTAEPNEPNSHGDGVWYRFTAPTAAHFRFSCSDNGSIWAEAFTGTTLDSLNEVAAGCPLVLEVAAGESFSIRVSSFGNGAPFDLTWEPIVVPIGPGAVIQDPGCRASILPANDDGSTGFVPIGFPINFFGVHREGLFVNNNGNVTFDNAMRTYTPFDLLSTHTQIIAPFFGDVDTRGAGSDVVTYGHTQYNGHDAFCVDWAGVGVGYYGARVDKVNSFQLLLVNRSDRQVGDFDIVFNYNQVVWETGEASNGVDGLGGFSARAGFSNGNALIPHSLELPGSAVNGALLDSDTSTGLIHNSRNTLQLGRYVFPVENGDAPTGGSIDGSVLGAGSPQGNAPVQACIQGGGCASVFSSGGGTYSFTGLPVGEYTLSAFPPASAGLLNSAPVHVTLAAGATVHDVNLLLTAPVGIPPEVQLGPTNGSIGGDIPVVYWGSPLTLTTHGCAGGTAEYEITIGGVLVRSGPMVEGPSGAYTATIAPLHPDHGLAIFSMTIHCPGGADHFDSFNVYIDPSGQVQDLQGHPVAGATVTLFRADDATGPYTAVPNESAIMSPSNRTNPDATDANGHFGWDVIAGFYKVRAEKAG